MTARQTDTLIKTFAKAIIKFPERINATVSKLKVEKVLNPPQKPTTSNIFNTGYPSILLLNTPTINAKIKQLTLFDKNVAKG